jgi:hypothetical protein
MIERIRACTKAQIHFPPTATQDEVEYFTKVLAKAAEREKNFENLRSLSFFRDINFKEIEKELTK